MAACTVVDQRTAFPDSEPGYDVRGSEVNAGRTQTTRREYHVVDGKALSDIPALKPYRGKLTVQDFRGSGGNVGIIRSPVRATALPGNGSGCNSPDRLGGGQATVPPIPIAEWNGRLGRGFRIGMSIITQLLQDGYLLDSANPNRLCWQTEQDPNWLR